MKSHRVLFVSVLLNFVLCIGLLVCVCKLQIISIPFCNNGQETSGGGYSYLDNPQYNAYNSMFEISKRHHAKIVFCGDSITAKGCFEEFFDETSVVNRGIGSDTTEGLLHRVKDIISLSPDAVFIMIGINDISTHADLKQSADFLMKTCHEIRTELPEADIYIESVLPTSTAEWEKSIKELNELYRKKCDEEGYVYVDIYSDFYTEGVLNTELLCDGVHLTGEGYRIWVEHIKDYIDK